MRHGEGTHGQWQSEQSWGPRVNFQPPAGRSQVAESPRPTGIQEETSWRLLCGTGAMWQTRQLPFWGREGRGSTEEANLGYLPQGGPLGRRNAIAFRTSYLPPSWCRRVSAAQCTHSWWTLEGRRICLWISLLGSSPLCGPHKHGWLCWLHNGPHLLKHGNFRPLARDRTKLEWSMGWAAWHGGRRTHTNEELNVAWSHIHEQISSGKKQIMSDCKIRGSN